MVRRLLLVAVWTCQLAVSAAPANAQVPLDRVVPKAPSGLPLTMASGWPQLVGSLARAMGVPMAVEYVDPGVIPADETMLTGLPLRDALDIVARVGRVEWREMDGVVVIRPAAAWTAGPHPLDFPVDALHVEDAIAQQALAVACAVLGASDSTVTAERRRFPIAFPGGRLIDFLNSVVRAHGALSWWFATTPRMPSPWRVSVGFSSGSSGVGCGAPGVTPETLDLKASVARRAVPVGPAERLLDQPVGANVHGQPLRLYGLVSSGVRDLATAVRVPIGLEAMPGPPLIFNEGFVATGAPLRLVLDALVTIDPRYEWRLLDGVVVMRPREAWDDPANPLAARAEAVRLLDEPIGNLVQALHRAIGVRQPSADFPDSRLVWVDLPPGTALDVVNALARAHGDLVWVFEEQDPEAVKATGLRHQLMLLAPNGGSGIPVR